MDDAMQPAENEWTKIPNALLENMADLGNAELRVLLALIRKTAGYQKESDRVSVSQLVTMTGLTSRNAQNALTSLLASGHIGREQAGKQTFAYHVKPYPVGTRIETNENHVPSDTRSLGDMVPYPVGTRFDEKPYPLGTTQKKDLKERKKESASVASDDAPTPAPEITEPTPVRKPRKPKAAAPVTPPAEMSEHKRLMTAYAEVLGYPFPNGGKEAAGARKLLDAGYTVEQVISAYCEMKAQAFWSARHVSLHNVIQDIGAILNRQESKQRAAAGRANGSHVNGAYTHHVAPADPGILDAAEMRRQMAELRAGGGK